MMDIEAAREAEIDTTVQAGVGEGNTGMKITVSKDELVAKLGVVSRAVSSRGTVQVLSGILLSAEAGTLSLAATDMELSLRTTLEAQVEGEGARRRSRQAPRRSRAAPAGERGHVPVPARRGCRARRLRDDVVPVEHLRGRGLPTPAGARRAAARNRPRRAARDDRPGRPLGLARRVTARAHRGPRSLRGGEADDGRDRLLPALGQGDASSRPRRRSSKRSSLRARSRSSPGWARRVARARRSSSACTRTTSSSGRARRREATRG